MGKVGLGRIGRIQSDPIRFFRIRPNPSDSSDSSTPRSHRPFSILRVYSILSLSVAFRMRIRPRFVAIAFCENHECSHITLTLPQGTRHDASVKTRAQYSDVPTPILSTTTYIILVSEFGLLVTVYELRLRLPCQIISKHGFYSSFTERRLLRALPLVWKALGSATTVLSHPTTRPPTVCGSMR